MAAKVKDARYLKRIGIERRRCECCGRATPHEPVSSIGPPRVACWHCGWMSLAENEPPELEPDEDDEDE